MRKHRERRRHPSLHPQSVPAVALCSRRSASEGGAGAVSLGAAGGTPGCQVLGVTVLPAQGAGGFLTRGLAPR